MIFGHTHRGADPARSTCDIERKQRKGQDDILSQEHPLMIVSHMPSELTKARNTGYALQLQSASIWFPQLCCLKNTVFAWDGGAPGVGRWGWPSPPFSQARGASSRRR